jgi:hypothetical protein
MLPSATIGGLLLGQSSCTSAAMRRKVVWTALATVVVVVAAIGLHQWGAATTWGSYELDHAYRSDKPIYMPWVWQFWYALAFVVVGAGVSALRRPRQWAVALEPWLASSGLLFFVSALAIATTPRFRLFSVQRNLHAPASPVYQPDMYALDWRQAAIYFGAAALSFVLFWSLRRRSAAFLAQPS